MTPARRRRWLFLVAVIEVSFAGDALFRLLFGHGAQRRRAAIDLAIMGWIGLAFAWVWWQSRPGRPTALEIQEVEEGERHVLGFVLTNRPSTVVSSTLFVLPLIAGCVALVVSSGNARSSGDRLVLRAVGISVAVILTVLTIVGVRRARRPALAFIPQGLSMRSGFTNRLIPWDSIADAAPHTRHFISMTGIMLRQEPIAEWSPVIRRMDRLTRRWFGWHILFPATLFGVNATVLARLVLRYAADPQARQAIGTQSELNAIRGLAAAGRHR